MYVMFHLLPGFTSAVSTSEDKLREIGENMAKAIKQVRITSNCMYIMQTKQL